MEEVFETIDVCNVLDFIKEIHFMTYRVVAKLLYSSYTALILSYF